ncbi:MAG: hypothetical protein NTY63_07280 [Candidatus Bipolaricaulota bacterium]|nr:hypothetical protein [Candidatus Bipolaricaulota bacterium]
MTRSYPLMDRDGWRPYFSLVLFCGIALTLSIPSARVVRDLASASFLSVLPTFFYAHALFMGLLGLALGTASAGRGEQGGRMLVSLALRVLLGQFLCLPYLVFARGLFPGRGETFALIALFTTLVSLALAVFGRWIEQPRRSGPSSGFLAKYALFIGYYAAPLAGLPLLSPLGAVGLLLEGVAPLEALLALLVPAALLGVLSPFAVRLKGEGHV